MNLEIHHYISVKNLIKKNNFLKSFFIAASYNSLNVLHYLLEEEFADPHNQSYNGFQAIHYACEHGHNECVKFLLSKSPDLVNQQTNQLLTPLHLACQGGSLETVQILISHGANLKLKDQNGSNCLHIGM